MARFKISKAKSMACCRKLACITIFLAITIDIFSNYEYTKNDCALHKNGGISPLSFSSVCAANQNQKLGNSRRNGCQSSHITFQGEDVSKNTIPDARTFNLNRSPPYELNLPPRPPSSNGTLARNFYFSKLTNNGIIRKLFTSRQERLPSLSETTRLVGGANHSPQIMDDSQQVPSESTSTIPTNDDTEKPSSSRRILLKAQNFLSPSSLAVGPTYKNLHRLIALMQKTTSQAGPSVLTGLSLLYSTRNKTGVSLLTLYAISLLGASCGFHLFLHFITLGYALGITLPLAVALIHYKKQYTLPLPTLLHSSMTILWGVRLFSFLAIREYYTWPALHQKVVEVQAKMKIPFASKMLCWVVYSFFYVSLVASCWSRLLQSNSLSPSSWGIIGYIGLSLQSFGLLLETIADIQKSSFKSQNRHSWCNTGVWKLSTHPNYLGEGLFWWGTYLAHGFHSPLPSTLATIGLVFILYVLKGSARSLSSKQKEKYGQEIEFYQFQRTHNVFGPKQMWSRRKTQSIDDAFASPVTHAEESSLPSNESDIPVPSD